MVSEAIHSYHNLVDNAAVFFTEYLLIYICDTESGSSGSPLIKTTDDGHHQVIALHRKYVKLDGDTYNCGTLICTIIDHILDNKDPSHYCESLYTFLQLSMWLYLL